MLHLGALIDTARGLFFFSFPSQTDMIAHAAQGLLGLTQVSALCLRQVTGLLVSCHTLVSLCMFRLHHLSSLLRDNFDMRVDRSSKLIRALLSNSTGWTFLVVVLGMLFSKWPYGLDQRKANAATPFLLPSLSCLLLVAGTRVLIPPVPHPGDRGFLEMGC